MKNLKTRDQFLLEKMHSPLITEASGNNTKWSETMIGKLFNWVIKVVTLDGFLVDKFKDAVGAKSFIIKNLANRLEKAIDALPGEYVQRNEEIDLQNLEMQHYNTLLNIIETLNKSRDFSIRKICSDLESSIINLKSIKSELDIKNEAQSKIAKTIEEELKIVEPILAKAKSTLEGLSNEEQATKVGYDFSKGIEKLGNKTEIKKNLDAIKAKMLNIIKNEKNEAKVSTESMYKIVSILNKARILYMEEDKEGETYYRGNKRETVFHPNRRLFSLWEKKVLEILSRKNDIIPKKLLAYINNSLASVDPIKYNVEVSRGVEKNVLDQLADVDIAVDEVERKFNPKRDSDKERERVTPVDVIPQGKSTSTGMHLKDQERISITQESLLRSMININVSIGNLFLFNEKRDDVEQMKFDSYSVIFVPTRTYVNGLVLGILSLNANVFQNAPTSGSAHIDVNNLGFNQSEFWRKDEHYYWAVLNKKDLQSNSNYLIKLFNPGVSYTNKNLLETYDDLIESLAINRAGKIKVVYGNDDKVVEIDKRYLDKKYNLDSTGYRSIDQYFNANKF